METDSKIYKVPREVLNHFEADEHNTPEMKDGARIGLIDEVIVESSRFYFVANINLHVHLNSEMTAKLQERGVMIRDYTGDDIEGPPMPEFFCTHYKKQHNPRDFRLGIQETIIDVDKLKELDRLWNLKQFQDLARKPILLSWRSIINSNGMGLILISFNTNEPLPATMHRKLSLIHLNFPVISTACLDYLFETNWEGNVPAHITFGMLCERFEIELNAVVRKVLLKIPPSRRRELFTLPGQTLERFRSLAFDTLVPIVVLNIRRPEGGAIEDWIQGHRSLLAKYVIKPELFEIGELSNTFIEELVNKSRLWSINNSSFALANYHGVVFVQFFPGTKSPTSQLPEFSGFWAGSEAAFVYTALISIQSYFALRIYDDYLDEKTSFLVRGEKKAHMQKIMKEDTRALSVFRTQKKSLDILQYVVEIIASVKSFVQNQDYIRGTKGGNRMEKLLLVVALLETLFGLLQVYFMLGAS